MKYTSLLVKPLATVLHEHALLIGGGGGGYEEKGLKEKHQAVDHKLC